MHWFQTTPIRKEELKPHNPGPHPFYHKSTTLNTYYLTITITIIIASAACHLRVSARDYAFLRVTDLNDAPEEVMVERQTCYLLEPLLEYRPPASTSLLLIPLEKL